MDTVGDRFYIQGETTGVYEGQMDEKRLDLEPVQVVKKGDLFSIKTTETVRRNDKLYKIEIVEEMIL